VQDVHIHSLIPAGKEGFEILFGLNTATDSCEHKRSWVDRLQIASRHLQNNGIRSWHDYDEFGAPFDTATSFVFLWLI